LGRQQYFWLNADMVRALCRTEGGALQQGPRLQPRTVQLCRPSTARAAAVSSASRCHHHQWAPQPHPGRSHSSPPRYCSCTPHTRDGGVPRWLPLARHGAPSVVDGCRLPAAADGVTRGRSGLHSPPCGSFPRRSHIWRRPFWCGRPRWGSVPDAHAGRRRGGAGRDGGPPHGGVGDAYCRRGCACSW